jgi:ribosomal protein S18 acetylase RimI-like enzyme
VTDVRLAQPADWAVVRDVRLRALADSPAAFASTLEREVAFDEAEWRSRVARGPWWLACDGERPVGLVAAFPEDGETHLVAMWVEPGSRGTTAATDLVDTVCRHAAADGARAVRLWVADGNDRARRFYERLGFAPTGERQPLPSAPEIGEELMRRALRA